MEEIIKLYNEHLTTPFPHLGGEEILGVDLVLVDCDTSGLISKYIDYRGQLTNEDLRLLSHYYSDLKTVTKELDGADRLYFSRLQNVAGLIIEKEKAAIVSVGKKSYIPEWESTFLKIREILNEWDPIGVAHSVDDEYDTMNFQTLSVILNKRDKKEIKSILDDYTRNTMQIAIDNDTLDKVADKISKLL